MSRLAGCPALMLRVTKACWPAQTLGPIKSRTAGSTEAFPLIRSVPSPHTLVLLISIGQVSQSTPDHL
jgi:hypothetical protein